jgi:hypothetical protein
MTSDGSNPRRKGIAPATIPGPATGNEPGRSALDVTPPKAADQHEHTDDTAQPGQWPQAVTEALNRVIRWARGTPSDSVLRATFFAVNRYGLSVVTSGSRVSFVDADGARYSVARVLRTARVVLIRDLARCDACGEPIPLDAYRRQQRGARTDRRYCSNACRQRAYRRRAATFRPLSVRLPGASGQVEAGDLRGAPQTEGGAGGEGP